MALSRGVKFDSRNRSSSSPVVSPPSAVQPGLHTGEWRNHGYDSTLIAWCKPPFLGKGDGNFECHHMFQKPEVIQESHWSCCGGRVESSTMCSGSGSKSKDFVPSPSSLRSGSSTTMTSLKEKKLHEWCALRKLKDYVVEGLIDFGVENPSDLVDLSDKDIAKFILEYTPGKKGKIQANRLKDAIKYVKSVKQKNTERPSM